MKQEIFRIVGNVERMGTVLCRILQKVLVVFIFFLFSIFAYSFLQFLFNQSPRGHHSDLRTQLFFLSLGLWLFYNLVYNYVMSNRVGPGYGQNLPSSVFIQYNIQKRCKKCNMKKPIRTHHCSICDKCILQMDHHCPWMGVCIGHTNRRYFIKFLTYLPASCFIVVALILNLDFPRTQVYMFMLTIGIVISGFAAYHWAIMLWGRTTLQFCQILDGYKPSKSIGRNFQIVFGTTNVLLAMLPIYIPLTYKGCQWNSLNSQSQRLNNMQLFENSLETTF